MRWVSISEFSSMLDPKARRTAEAQYANQCIEQAKIEQAERHHYERMALEREKLDAHAESSRIQAQAAYALETLKHDNALSLANRNHLLDVAGKSSALIDEMTMSLLRQDEEWNRTVSETFKTLVGKEADLIFQERLKALDQKHLVQKLTLESNLRMVEVVLAHELQNARLVFDKTCEIIFRLIERTLDLKDEVAEADSVREWVREAMEQTGAQ